MSDLEAYISIAAGLIAVIAGIYGFFGWLDKNKIRKPSGVYNKEGNIYLTYADGSSKQVTFSHADVYELLGKSKVIFYRAETIERETPYTRYKIMSANLKTLKLELISDQKPFSDGQDGSFEILQPGPPIFNPNQTKILFVIEKYATGSQLVSVEIKTGRWTELFSVEHFEVISSGDYRNNLLVGVSEIGPRGRDIYYKVCDFQGKILKEFNDYDSYMEFRGVVMVK